MTGWDLCDHSFLYLCFLCFFYLLFSFGSTASASLSWSWPFCIFAHVTALVVFLRAYIPDFYSSLIALFC
ncbi:hypothetical protein BDV26DRAFT_127108 [Aspergillus bertholletiae]|uniref:Uncharacterized protein n=1 Tax=Aspergillus bertholletiae TaxID=1226010 RepID=A0A5N7BFP5_9EURO|nr:hypothetical protein BDV26DRAFT_127108 [Aspergillus bertholletiae]